MFKLKESEITYKGLAWFPWVHQNLTNVQRQILVNGLNATLETSKSEGIDLGINIAREEIQAFIKEM